MTSRVALDDRVRAAFHPLPTVAPVGSIWLLADGRAVRVEGNGTVELVRGDLACHRSVSSDPTAGRPRR